MQKNSSRHDASTIVRTAYSVAWNYILAVSQQQLRVYQLQFKILFQSSFFTLTTMLYVKETRIFVRLVHEVVDLHFPF